MALLMLTVGQAQRESVTLTLGYNNEIVSERWNPVRIVSRDVPPAELIITLDQGSLRVGAIPAEYRVSLPGGSGVSIFEDDIFIPSFRALTWRIATQERVLASGSYDRRSINPEPVHLILSASPGPYLDSYVGLRAVDISSGDLSTRLAAYDGVASLLLDGSAAAPSLEAISAAMVAGVSVLTLPNLPGSHTAIAELAENYPYLGTGTLQEVSADGLRDRLSTLLSAPWRGAPAALITPDLLQYPASAPQLPLLVAVAGYLLLLLLLLRFGGIPGLLSSVLLAVFAGVMAWGYLRSDTAQFDAARTLELSRGPLARVERVHSLISLPATEIRREGAAVPQQILAYRQSDTATHFAAGRWSQSTWIERPRLATASFFWRQDRLVSAHRQPLTDIYIIGLGGQPDLSEGATLQPQPGEAAPSETYQALLPYLPTGTALATHGETIFAALPLEMTLGMTQ